MPKKKSSSAQDKLLAAALRLASQRLWNSLTLADISKAAKTTPTQAAKVFADKSDILAAIVTRFDSEVASALRKAPQGTPRDRLFEILMARFDILQKNRAAIVSIMESARSDPSLLRVLVPAHMKAMRRMLALAKLPANESQEIPAAAGLMIAYAAAVRIWKNDTSKDLAATMAALDKALRIADRCAEIIFPLAK